MSILEQDRVEADDERQNSSYFQNFSKHDFEDWLRTGLEKHLQGVGPEAFPGASAELARYTYPAEGLEAAYNKFPPDQQSNFRLAVADLINSWELTEENALLLEHLLHLAAVLPGREVLRGLAAWVRSGYFQRVPEAMASRLFNQVFLTATRLAAPTRESVDCIRELVTLPQFRAAWAGMALEALWFCDSGNITSHFQRLRPFLGELMTGAPNRPRVWAKRILDTVGLYKLIQVLPALKYYDQEHDDTWLLKGLLAGKQSPLECWIDESGDKFNFRLTGKPDTQETLPLESIWSDLFAYLREQKMIAKPNDQEADSHAKQIREWFGPLGEAANDMLYKESVYAH